MRAQLSIALATWALAACQSTALRSDQAAWIASPSPAARAELAQAIRTLLGEREILIAENAFTSSHILVLEPAIREQLQGRVLGRNLDRPERLELMLRDRRCYLVHAVSGEHVRLREARCIPAGA